MGKIHLLDSDTINQIAAGEVVERPASAVKELVENAVDAGASAVTVEIKEGGIGLIRVTDNGSGIAREDIPVAFSRHATSKIATALDLLCVKSLGFRGEALSSIAAVSMVELVTKTRGELTGSRYVIEGGQEKEFMEIGAPEGTTFLVRTLFYNTPARRKFLKSAMTEAGYISDLMERFAIAHPEISFKFINNGKTVLQTSGNGNLKDGIYHIFGRDIAAALVEADGNADAIRISGFLGKPVISRGNRNYENYFINGRHIKSNIISKAIEEAYKPYSMQHKYPFTALHFTIPTEYIDVNVHPTKLEVRFTNGEALYQLVYRTVRDALSGKNMIPDAVLSQEKRVRTVYQPTPEIFEHGRMTQTKEALRDAAERVREEAIHATLASPLFSQTGDGRGEAAGSGQERLLREEVMYGQAADRTGDDAARGKEAEGAGSAILGSHTADRTGAEPTERKAAESTRANAPCIGAADGSFAIAPALNAAGEPSVNGHGTVKEPDAGQHTGAGGNPPESALGKNQYEEAFADINTPSQLSLFETAERGKEAFLKQSEEEHHRIIGQLFATYWLVEFHEQLFIIDQHAAHEKILYEHTVARMKEKQALSQMLTPPIILPLSLREEETLNRYMEHFLSLGFEIEAFGGREYAVSAVPADLYGVDGRALLLALLDELVAEPPAGTPDIILDKIASMSCKAAVKGNMRLSDQEARGLIHELLRLENPFHCPHGRPIIISMTRNELERKFKRIIN